MTFDIAGGAVAGAGCWRVVARGLGYILASLLHGALDAEALHIGVGRYLGLDVVSLEDERQRHSERKECNDGDSNEYDEKSV